MASTGRTLAVQALMVQGAVTAVLALAALSFDHRWAGSILVGGLIAMAGHGAVTMAAYRPYRADRPDALTQRLMFAEVLRLLVVGAAFALTFANWRTPSVPALFASFLLIHLVPAWWIHRRSS